MSHEIFFSSDPFGVSGMRSAGWYGPIEIERRISGKSWEEGIDEVMADAAGRARDVGCNAVVGMEITCDPYYREGGLISLKATLARLEPLFAGVSVYP